MLGLRKTQVSPTTETDYPAGTFLKTEKGYFYISSSEKRLWIISKRVLDSWSPPRVVETTEAAVKRYRISSKMKFRNGSLIHNLSDGKIYLIVSGKRCHITSPDVFDRIGAVRDRKNIISVSLNEIKLHQEGEPLS